ncbi:hypothetical protein [Nocardioides dongkuii]|uniref:hypothetical protein n=1 Tax=Nocardioides dongkuii TaxID=2760089 RepID=UPI001877ADFA|nr:hypothetical protein [Nocardioides dongkuii]
MDPRMLARVCGVLGGLAWVVRWALAGQDAGAGALDAAYWAGLALLGIGLAGAGAALVSPRTPWLRALVAVCFPLLGWSVLMVLRDAVGGAEHDARLDGLLGVLALLVWVPLVVRSRRARPRAHAGTHAA